MNTKIRYSIAQIIPDQVQQLLEYDSVVLGLQVAAVAFGGFIVLKFITLIVTRVIMRRMSEQSIMGARKLILYTGIVLLFMIVLAQVGLDLGALLGAAGVVGIAVGIAAQASLSNIIAGMFLISENAFSIGDIIKVNDTVGTVLGVDLLSVKIRTFQNTFVRIPNELLIKTEVINITRFPIRRVDIELRIDIQTSVDQVRELLMAIAESNPLILQEPTPHFYVRRFAEYGVELVFGVWFSKNDFIAVKNSIMIEIQRKFEKERIAIPQSVIVPRD